jgi:hypothetical protein
MAQSARSPLVAESDFAAAPRNEGYASAVSWPAVFAGAFVASALSLSLLALGTGFGLSSISPWSGVGASASAISKAAIVWMIVMQIVSSSMGGYLAGRVRTKWVNVHTDEVYFRDTAHGFLVWAVGVVVTAAFLTSAAAAMVGGAGTQSTSTGVPASNRSLDASEYFADSLLRSDHITTDQGDASLREVGLILANSLRRGSLPAADKSYLTQVVAAKTGLSQNEAENRVSGVYDEARQAADNARKAVAHSLYWLFLALLIGAFCASYAATVGGRQRDSVVHL